MLCEGYLPVLLLLQKMLVSVLRQQSLMCLIFNTSGRISAVFQGIITTVI